MTVAEGLDAATFREGLLAAGRRIAEERDLLSELDAAAGDGDLGATLAAGFVHVETVLSAADGADIGELLKQTGLTLARKAPSTIGALLGGAFINAGNEFQNVELLSADDAAKLMRVLRDAVSERGGAVPGQRTVVDALDAASTAAQAALAAHATVTDVLLSAAQGAATAAERTADMEPHFGRAAWVADRARGHRDAGATAWAIYLTALADAVAA
jgi:dihydroxyacetone kinase-like protein